MLNSEHRVERMVSVDPVGAAVEFPGVFLKTAVSESCGAASFSTGVAIFNEDASLPYHSHACSEAITILEGRARVLVAGRGYQLLQHDCIHIPAGTPHAVSSDNPKNRLVAHWALASARPERTIVEASFTQEGKNSASQTRPEPETIVRFRQEAAHEWSPGALFWDLFGSRYGAVGICGGYASFAPGASLPCHFHDFDESISIVQGRATCLVQGRKYELSDLGTAFVPNGLPHRFVNRSNEAMAMIWVYAGGEPGRCIVDSHFCGDLDKQSSA